MNYNGKYCWYINFICAPYWWFIVYLHRFIVCALLDLMIALSGSHHHHRIIHDSSIVIYRASIVICRLFIYSSFVDYVCLLFMVCCYIEKHIYSQSIKPRETSTFVIYKLWFGFTLDLFWKWVSSLSKTSIVTHF